MHKTCVAVAYKRYWIDFDTTLDNYYNCCIYLQQGNDDKTSFHLLLDDCITTLKWQDTELSDRSVTFHDFYHTYFTIRKWLQKAFHLLFDDYITTLKWQDASWVMARVLTGLANASINWDKRRGSFIQQLDHTGPTNWGPKLVHTMILSFSIIVLALQYSSRYKPWMQLQKDSLSINNSLLFITYLWPS